jgi:hypothetical protein
MFISNKEAEDRLRDDRNIFRDGDAITRPSGVPATSNQSRLQRIEKLREEQELIDQAKARRAQLDNEDSTISLSHLDSLLSPRIKSKPYTNPDVQAAVAETALVLGASMAGAIFDRDSQQPRRMSHGFTNGFDGDAGIPSPALVSRLTRIKERLAEKAADKIDAAMEALTPQKISSIKRATNLAKVAKDMSSVMEKCEPKKDAEGAGVHFHIYRPEASPVSKYETVTVGPKVIDVGSGVTP